MANVPGVDGAAPTPEYDYGKTMSDVMDETYYVNSKNAKDAKPLSSNSAEISSNLKLMEKFDNTAFGVGETDAFKTLSDEFEGAIEELSAQIDDYASYANECIAAVNKAIEKDEKALDLANKAASAVEDVYSPTGEKDEDGNDILAYDAEATAAARKKAFDETWEANRWKDPEFKVSR